MAVGTIARRAAIDESKAALTHQALANDLITARLIANVVQQKLAWRVRLLEEEAGSEGLRRELAGAKSHDQLHHWLRQMKDRRSLNSKSLFYLLITDNQGQMLTSMDLRKPDEERMDLLAKQWGWRLVQRRAALL